jgi:hypothetical protein
MPLGLGHVPARPSRLLARRDGQPSLDPSDPGLQTGLLGPQIPLGQAPLVLVGPRDRARPTRRRLRRQRPLPLPPGHGLPSRVEPPLRASRSQVAPGQRPQVRAGRPQHRLILRRHPQPGTDPRPDRGGGNERASDLPQRSGHDVSRGCLGRRPGSAPFKPAGRRADAGRCWVRMEGVDSREAAQTQLNRHRVRIDDDTPLGIAFLLSRERQRRLVIRTCVRRQSPIMRADPTRSAPLNRRPLR